MIGNALLAVLALLFVAGLLLGALADPVWLWLAVGPTALFLIVWSLAALAEKTLKGLKIP
ncbi:MAG: hypothetical protein A2792_00085 [Sphingomonadales bacterium RIFCSPHIGHO2_01_FULL_65_20]|nr:MAG: hypothetical protein A2792_00085 [Sphingomonadales bacterium RIFCSPHIGHO2_01_FULL_65_20]